LLCYNTIEMNKFSVPVIACLVSVALAFDGLGCQKGDMDSGCKYTDQEDWAYMIMVESWPGSFCDDGCCHLPADVTQTPTGFTMHGMWPQYEGKDYPSCCESPYTRTNILNTIFNDKAIKAELDTHWPSLKRCKFVLYETEKHGTCAATVYNGTRGYIDYWRAAMNVFKHYDLSAALRKAGIVASATQYYSEADIKAAIEPVIGAKVNLHCATGNTKLLSEIRICLQRPRTEAEKLNPVPFNCPRLETSCSPKRILLPPLGKLTPGTCLD